MFGWFKSKPRCPVTSGEKAEVERPLHWLGTQLGWKPLHNLKTVLPTGEFFPLPYTAKSEEIEAVYEKLCEWMAVPVGEVEFQQVDHVTANSDPLNSSRENVGYHPATEEFPQPLILVDANTAVDLEVLTSFLAVQLSLHKLTTDPALQTVESDYFWVTCELLPLWFGLGIFASNAVLRDNSWSSMGWEYWQMHRRSNLTAMQFGYALGLIEWLGDKSDSPAWARYLRRDAEVAMTESLKYLQATDDTLTSRGEFQQDRTRPLAGILPSGLTGDSASLRILAMELAREPAQLARREELLPLVAENLRHADRIVRAEAAATLDRFGDLCNRCRDDLLLALGDRSPGVRTRVALALGNVRDEPDMVLPDLIGTLKDTDLQTANAAANSLAKFGIAAQEAKTPLLRLFKLGVAHCSDVLVDQSLEALHKIFGDPLLIIQEEYTDRDPELLRAAEEAWARLQNPEAVSEETTD